MIKNNNGSDIPTISTFEVANMAAKMAGIKNRNNKFLLGFLVVSFSHK